MIIKMFKKFKSRVGVCLENGHEHKERPRFPMTPAEVVRQFGDRLTHSNVKEMSSYRELWYLGKEIDSSNHHDISSNDNTQVSNNHLAYRYELLKRLGEGSYGTVYKCLDHKTNEMVAVKIIKKFKSYRQEVEIMDYLRKKDRNGSYNIVLMKNNFFFRKQLCIVYDLLGPSLNQLKKHRRFSSANLQHICKDILKCLRLLEKEKIIHGDLKPGNIVLGKNGIKVIDFGGSSFEKKKKFPGAVTYTYSSPEVILKNPCSTATDMWSLGCILAELHIGQYIFSGADAEQIALIMEVLGKPPADFFKDKNTWNYFYDDKGQWRDFYDVNNVLIKPGSKNLQKILGTGDLQFLDFIQRCLSWNPAKRLTPSEAMKHPWLQSKS
ncbi:dual specificity tyrosine-phosphorylation-regulated kinase 4-like isoform X2 [Tachysurus fulvidraco]|uniref:dual specificity tyrosine-phosphorylation-regulated kinase 4-like isoform X2 n=1 Tax=Tachysurus fulvidraco TaxID=1234273 RepID=UPI001FEE1FE1|nr:dual specificity tyrosine-phosphorylation-regulated kinase 4-like isoform X2 [Tachysurus fulvidraco]